MGHSGLSLGKSYPSAVMKSVYSSALENWAIQAIRLGSLTPLQRYNRCILQPQPTETRWGCFTHRKRCSACFFFCSSMRMGHPGHSLRESYPPTVIQSVYSVAPADWANWGSLSTLQRCSRYILHPQPTGPLGEVLTLNKVVVGVFCNPHATGQEKKKE